MTRGRRPDSQGVPTPNRAVVLTVICTVGALLVGLCLGISGTLAVDLLKQPVNCAERKDATRVKNGLEEQHSPPLARLAIKGMCDDEASWYGVAARVAVDRPGQVVTLLRSWGCRSYGTADQPIVEDVDPSASARLECDLDGVGVVRVAIAPDAPVPLPRGPGIGMWFVSESGIERAEW